MVGPQISTRVATSGAPLHTFLMMYHKELTILRIPWNKQPVVDLFPPPLKLLMRMIIISMTGPATTITVISLGKTRRKTSMQEKKITPCSTEESMLLIKQKRTTMNLHWIPVDLLSLRRYLILLSRTSNFSLMRSKITARTTTTKLHLLLSMLGIYQHKQILSGLSGRALCMELILQTRLLPKIYKAQLKFN